MTRGVRESMSAFNARVDKVTNEQLFNAARRNSRVAKKRREWAATRKQKKRDKTAQREARAMVEDPLNRRDVVTFGDVTTAPPQLQLKVRPGRLNSSKAPLLLE